MTTPDPNPTSFASGLTLQQSYRKAASVHDLARHHYIEAARLHDIGDQGRARIHANLAEDHALAALAAGAPTFGA
jgi:hypothetical protein